MKKIIKSFYVSKMAVDKIKKGDSLTSISLQDVRSTRATEKIDIYIKEYKKVLIEEEKIDDLILSGFTKEQIKLIKAKVFSGR